MKLPSPIDDDPDHDRDGDVPSQLHQLTLRQLVGSPPPPGTVQRVAWWMHIVGYLVPPRKRVRQFGPGFLEDFEDFARSLPEDRNVWACSMLLARHMAWTFASAWQCFWTRFSEDAETKSGRASTVNFFIVPDQWNDTDVPLNDIGQDSYPDDHSLGHGGDSSRDDV